MLAGQAFASSVTGPIFNPAAVAIRGGAINGTTVGATTPAAGTFSTLTSAGVAITGGTIDISSTLGYPNRVVASTTSGNGTGVYGGSTGGGYGVEGYATGTGIAVFGSNINTGYGIYGTSSSTAVGVFGTNQSTGIGVQGTNSGTGYGVSGDKYHVTTSLKLNTRLLFSATSPTILSGFGAGANVDRVNGTLYVRVYVGTSPPSSGVLTFPAAPIAWGCVVQQMGAPQVNAITVQSGWSTTSVTLTNYDITTGLALNWSSGREIHMICVPN